MNFPTLQSMNKITALELSKIVKEEEIAVII